MVRILKVYDRNIFEIYDNYIKITFRFNEIKNVNKRDSNEPQMSRKGVANESKIIDYLNKHGNITSKEAIEILKLSKSQTNKILSKMRENGLIEKVGKSVNTYYILK